MPSLRVASIAAAAVVLGTATTPLPGQTTSGATHDISIGLRVSTLGYGAEVAKWLTPHFGVRVGANTYSHRFSQEESDVSYDVKLKLKAVSLLVDFFTSPRGAFHITGGLMTAPAEVSGTGEPKGGSTFTINDVEYPMAEVGTLTASGEWPGALPYLGIGWGTPAAAHRGVRFVFDLGVGIGSPTIDLDATGAAANSSLAADLAEEEASAQDDVRKYLVVYPVLSFGLVYRF